MRARTTLFVALREKWVKAVTIERQWLMTSTLHTKLP
jgi:hypothetical protein